MNELRKWISDELIDHAKNYERAFDSDRVERTHEATDRILALIAEAMLSDEAVEAAAKALYDTEAPFCDLQGNPQSYEHALSPIGQFNYLKRTRKILAAAAGITPGDAREGGEGE